MNFFELDVCLYIDHLRCDLRRIRIQFVEPSERLARAFFPAFGQEPAWRFWKHHDADAEEKTQRDLTDDGGFPLPVVRDFDSQSGSCTHGRSRHVPHGESDVVKAHHQASLAGGTAFGAIYNAGGQQLADTDTTDAFASHVVQEATGRAQHTSGADDQEDTGDLDGAPTAEVVTRDTSEGTTESHEKRTDADERLLRCGELAFHQHFTGLRIWGHATVAKCVVVRRHDENDTAVSGVEVGDPRGKGNPGAEEQHIAGSFRLSRIDSILVGLDVGDVGLLDLVRRRHLGVSVVHVHEGDVFLATETETGQRRTSGCRCFGISVDAPLLVQGGLQVVCCSLVKPLFEPDSMGSGVRGKCMRAIAETQALVQPLIRAGDVSISPQ